MRVIALLAASLALSACVADEGPSDPYPFVGSWACGAKTFSFTNTTYNDGTKTFPIRAVSKNGMNYTLRFSNGYVLGLGAVTDTGLTWISGGTGEQINCRRVN